MPETTTTEAKRLPPVFEESSQYQHWRFSPEQLWDIRNKSTEAAVNRVKKNIQEELNTSDSQEEKKKIQYLTSKEEFALCRYFEAQIPYMCAHCKFSNMVMATALIYMKRFFLYNTIMDYYPKDILLTCLFLATKSESERISIEDYKTRLGLGSATRILDLEFTVSQGLKFQYYVHHPYRPAYGFFLDMQTGPTDIKLLRETYRSVTSDVITKILMTDLPLIYQPTQLALAAFMIAGESNGFDSQVEKYIMDRFGEKKDAESLLSILKDIIKIYKRDQEPTGKDEAKAIDLKLKNCNNPAMNPDSAIFKKRLAEREEQHVQKKARTGIDTSDSSNENSPSASSAANGNTTQQKSA